MFNLQYGYKFSKNGKRKLFGHGKKLFGYGKKQTGKYRKQDSKKKSKGLVTKMVRKSSNIKTKITLVK